MCLYPSKKKMHQTNNKNVCLNCIFVKGMFSKGLMDGFGTFTRAAGLKYEVAYRNYALKTNCTVSFLKQGF